MLQATLKRKGKGVAPLMQVDLPEALSELPLSRYIDFLTESKNIGKEGQNQILSMARAVGAFLNVPLDELLTAEIGDIYQEETVGLDGSLRKLYGYCINLIAPFKPALLTPEDAHFMYKGERFEIPVILQQALVGEALLPDVETIEAIEAAEVQRYTYQATEKVGDADGSLAYSMYLKMLAVLARKQGERLPIDDGQRELWINNRAIHFQEIDAATALNVDFFLASIFPNSELNHTVGGSLSRQSFVLVVETLLKKGKPTTGHKTIMRKFSRGSGGGNSSLRSLKRGG